MAWFRTLLFKKPPMAFMKSQSLSTTVMPYFSCEKSSDLRLAFGSIPLLSSILLKQQLVADMLPNYSMVISNVSGGGRFSMVSRTIATTSCAKNTQADGGSSGGANTSQADGGSSSGANTVEEVAPRIKFKKTTKTARHIMQILDKEAVQSVKAEREIPDIRPGYVIQIKTEVPENKRRVSVLKGIVIARRNAGLNTTFRIRRLVAGVAVESVFPLYSPNIKEIKVLDQKKVRRAKLYYLREKMGSTGKK